MNEYSEKLEFAIRSRFEIKPLLSDTERHILEEVEAGRTNEGALNILLERFETRIFSLQKKRNNYEKQARRVLFTFADTGAFNVLGPILSRLENDPRIKSIGVITHGVAGISFQKLGEKRFIQIRESPKPVLHDILQLVQIAPPDLVMTSISTQNGPEAVVLYGGKSILGAKKLFLVVDGWTGLGSAFSGSHERMDQIDGIFCNDEFAKRVIQRFLPKFPEERIYPTGTPTLDSLEVERAEEYRTLGRQKLELGEDVQATLYLGGIQNVFQDLYDSHPGIEEETFRETVKAIADMAKLLPNKKFAILVRPHPADAEKDRIFNMIGLELPQNLRVISATSTNMNESVYAADIIVSLVSAENFKAPLRGKRGIFLGYTGERMGSNLLKKVFGQELVEEMGKSNVGVEIAHSPEHLADLLREEQKEEGVSYAAVSESVNKILEVVLS